MKTSSYIYETISPAIETLIGAATICALAAFMVLASTQTLAQTTKESEPKKVQVMILGSYHFDNPGLDVAKVKVENVLSKNKQKEIQSIVDGLAQFSPHKVMVEVNADKINDRAIGSYSLFLQDTHNHLLKNEASEIYQIGYRLAKQLKHEKVYGVDTSWEFPFQEWMDYANANGFQENVNRAMLRVKQHEIEFNTDQRNLTIAQILRKLNTPNQILEDQYWYSEQLKVGKGDKQVGANLIAKWAERNYQICARIVQTAQAGDKIVVLYGSGHNYYLRQCVKEMKAWELVEPNDYLPLQ